MADNGYDPTDRQDVREAEKAARAAAREDADVVRLIMRSTSGRSWAYRKLEACHINSTTFSGDALRGAFAEGERNIGLMLMLEIVNACPDEYIQMMREANARSIATDASRSARKQRRLIDTTDGDATDIYVDYTASGGSDT